MFGIHIHGVCIEPEVKGLKAGVACFYRFAGPNAAEKKGLQKRFAQCAPILDIKLGSKLN